MRRSSCSARRTVITSLGVLTIGGCRLGTGPVDGEFRGIYFSAFEASSFRECRRPWTESWLTGELGATHDVMPPIDPAASRAAYVHLRGTRSRPGRYGHAGGWRYELVVEQVLEASADTMRKCR
jgi:hypothetical protein